MTCARLCEMFEQSVMQLRKIRMN